MRNSALSNLSVTVTMCNLVLAIATGIGLTFAQSPGDRSTTLQFRRAGSQCDATTEIRVCSERVSAERKKDATGDSAGAIKSQCRLARMYVECLMPVWKCRKLAPILKGLMKYNQPPFECNIKIPDATTRAGSSCDRKVVTACAQRLLDATKKAYDYSMATGDTAGMIKRTCRNAREYVGCLKPVLKCLKLVPVMKKAFEAFNKPPFRCNIEIPFSTDDRLTTRPSTKDRLTTRPSTKDRLITRPSTKDPRLTTGLCRNQLESCRRNLTEMMSRTKTREPRGRVNRVARCRNARQHVTCLRRTLIDCPEHSADIKKTMDSFNKSPTYCDIKLQPSSSVTISTLTSLVTVMLAILAATGFH